MIPHFTAAELAGDRHRTRLAQAIRDVGFLTVGQTALSAARVEQVLAAYRDFFALPQSVKAGVDMARTGANRGWGGPRSEQVDANANPDLKEVFDCGFELPQGDPAAGLRVYAPNVWPEGPGFRHVLEAYYRDAMAVALSILRGVAQAIGAPPEYFDEAFSRPMALLRGNYYPTRPDWAGEKDFGIAPHTDYGCLTLLATDGAPGLEVQTRDGNWIPIAVPPGEFVINFGEMLEMWTEGGVRATPHRVRGGSDERLSVPLFFNPNHDTNVAPPGSDQVILAVDHLQKRFDETYVHLQDKADG